MVNGAKTSGNSIMISQNPGAATPGTGQQTPRRRGFRRFLGPIAGAVLLGGGVTLWNSDVLTPWRNEPIVTYGEPSQTKFVPDTVRAGQKANLCFEGVEWFKVCRSELIYNVTCYVRAPGAPPDLNLVIERRFDYQVYTISTPPAPQKVDAKCRQIVMPEDCLPGRLTHRAFARHECGPLGSYRPSYTPMPNVTATVIK